MSKEKRGAINPRSKEITDVEIVPFDSTINTEEEKLKKKQDLDKLIEETKKAKEKKDQMYKKTGQVKKTKTKDITPETPQVGIKPFVETEYNKEFKILNKKYNNELKKVSKIDRDKTISELNKKYFPLVQELKIKYGINPEPALKDYYAKGNEDEPIIENSNVIEDTKINLGKINVNQEKIIEEKRLAEEKLKEELEKKRKIQEQLDAINAKLEKIKKEKEKEEGIKKIKDDIESKLK